MNVSATLGAAKRVIETLDLASEDYDYEYYHALLEDEEFRAVCYHWKSISLYADGGPNATQHEQDAVEALSRAVREHAQRVLGEVS